MLHAAADAVVENRILSDKHLSSLNSVYQYCEMHRIPALRGEVQEYSTCIRCRHLRSGEFDLTECLPELFGKAFSGASLGPVEYPDSRLGICSWCRRSCRQLFEMDEGAHSAAEAIRGARTRTPGQQYQAQHHQRSAGQPQRWNRWYASLQQHGLVHAAAERFKPLNLPEFQRQNYSAMRIVR